jgi:predicted CDP-diglyceride synthetase/phosphatidate cytidylyltransferase
VSLKAVRVLGSTTRVLKRVAEFILGVEIPSCLDLATVVSVLHGGETSRRQLHQRRLLLGRHLARHLALLSRLKPVLISIAAAVIESHAFAVYFIEVPVDLVLIACSVIHWQRAWILRKASEIIYVWDNNIFIIEHIALFLPISFAPQVVRHSNSLSKLFALPSQPE